MTTMFPRVQFVDAPHGGATVLADLNAHLMAEVRTVHDGFSLGMPTLSGDAGRRGRSWGKRRLQVPVYVAGDRQVAIAQHKALSRVAARDGWLLFQLDVDTPPVWFRTYATEPEPVDFEFVGRGAQDRWGFMFPLDADPFGVGEEITLGPYTVPNTTAGGGMRVELPEVKGDMPAPAAVKIARAGGLVHGPAVSITPTTPAAVSVSTWGPAVGSQATSPNYIAGGYRPTTGTLEAWTTVATWAPNSLPPGRWRFLVRLSGSTTSGSFAARLRLTSGGVTADVAPTIIEVRQQRRWVDVGQGPWPLGDASALGVPAGTSISLQVRRLDGSGELYFDAPLLMVPVSDDATLLGLQLADVGTSDTTVLIDAAERRALAVASGSPQRAPGVRGGWPVLRPGASNVLTVVQNLDPTLLADRHDDIASPSVVTLSYRPQYLWGVA